VDPRAGLDEVEKRKFLTLPGIELQNLGRPTRSQSLHRLRYPGSCYFSKIRLNIVTAQTRQNWLQMFKMTTFITNALLTTALKRALCFLYCCCLRSCNVLGYAAYALVFRAPHRHKSKSVKPGDAGG
jgi:hypothetical protein